jgi:hypothetical protein
MRRIALVAALAVAAVLPAAAAAKSGHEHGGGHEATLTVSPVPPDIRAGDTWTPLMLASRGTQPLSHENFAVTISNPFTGRAQTYYSDETAPGRYEARVVFPTEGWWQVVAGGNGLVAEVPSADVAPRSSGPSPWPWVITAAAAAALLGGAAALGRRLRHRDAPEAAPAEG